jgi:hypothetical protein
VSDIDWSYMYRGLIDGDEEDEDIPAQVTNDIAGVDEYCPIYVFDFASEYPPCTKWREKDPNLSLRSDICILCRIAVI